MDTEKYRKLVQVKCPVCSALFGQRPKDERPKTCSRHCARKLDAVRYGPKNWKGGRYKHASGYVKVLCKDHPKADGNGYIMEHRVVMERVLRRQLQPHEHVHHKNGVRDDNRRENLELWQGKDPPGRRVADQITHVLEQPELRRMNKKSIEAALRRVLLGES